LPYPVKNLLQYFGLFFTGFTEMKQVIHDMGEIVFPGPKRTWSIILVNISGAPNRPKTNLSYWKEPQGMIMPVLCLSSGIKGIW
jgi:hypothetical protein